MLGNGNEATTIVTGVGWTGWTSKMGKETADVFIFCCFYHSPTGGVLNFLLFVWAFQPGYHFSMYLLRGICIGDS